MGVKTLHRLQLHPRGATLSPWQADTLFGHLCWQIYFEKGKTGLADFLAPFRAGAPPFVLSDGFPGDWLPRPFLPPRPPKATSGDAKKIKKVSWLTPTEFQTVLRGDDLDVSDDESPVREPQVVLKNQINRLTGTTAGDDEGAGNLYAVDEIAFYQGKDKREGMPVSVYFWAQDATQADEVTRLFGLLARGGYGKKKSVGYGQFTVSERTTLNFEYQDADGVVALASFVPRQTDPTDGYYRTRVKYGKLGEGGIVDGKAYSPFKFPLVMLTAGSTFRTDPARAFVGRLVAPIHPQDLEGKEFVQYAFAPVVPIKLPPEA